MVSGTMRTRRGRSVRICGARNRLGGRGGRPPAFDRGRYKQRNAVERTISKLKQWRGLATRYNKTATIYLAGLHLAAIHIWSASESPRNGLAVSHEDPVEIGWVGRDLVGIGRGDRHRDAEVPELGDLPDLTIAGGILDRDPAR